MKTCKKVSKLKATKALYILLLLVFCFCGCTKTGRISGISKQNEPNIISIYNQYAPVKIDILPLTEFNTNKEAGQSEIDLFVSLLDSFGSQIKSPCIFRFELYPRIQRSSEAKGGRVKIWPDVNLIDPKVNNEYWQYFLRAYEFHLPFEPQTGQNYILEVTCMCLNNTRISSEFLLKTSE